MKTLYTRDASGATRFWRMELNHDDPTQYRTISGVLGGTEVPTAWTTATPKNVGRANATTAAEQAVAEMEATYRQKLDRKYHEDPNNVGAHKFFAPMLAKTLDDRVKQVLGRVAFIQPKLDGYRCVASVGGLHSRQGKPWHLPHIVEALQPFFDEDPDRLFDGELYNHDLRDDFNTLGSLIKKGNRSSAEEERVRSTIQYHVYDLPGHSGGFSARIGELHTVYGYSKGLYDPLYDGPIRLVETHPITTLESIDSHYGAFMEQGYEGAMVRLDMPYEAGKRSKGLLKLKDFQDGEFELVRVEEGIGNWAGYAKTAVIRLADGREQSSGMRGSREFLAQVLRDWKRYSQVTVRYQNVTPDGFLRFPIIVDWHEGPRTY